MHRRRVLDLDSKPSVRRQRLGRPAWFLTELFKDCATSVSQGPAVFADCMTVGSARPCEVFMHRVPKPDRRSPSRPLDPSTCPECHALATSALFRTDTAVYYHCGRCAYLWCIQKPVQTINNVPAFHNFDWGSFPNE